MRNIEYVWCQQQCDIEWREFVKAHTIAGEEELSVIRKFVVESYQPK